MMGHHPLNTAATIVRQHDGRLVDVSGVGCLIESSASIAPGTVGMLEATIDGEVYVEAVRVARLVMNHNGRGVNRIGLDFLLLAPPGAHSIRAIVTRLAGGADPHITFVH
jgi:hypothetical protein